MSTVYRDRERSRYEDDRTTVSARTGGGTKVTRYIVKEDDYKSDAGRRTTYDDRRSTIQESRYDDARSHYDRGRDDREEIRVIRKEREEELPVRREVREEPRYTRESITVLRDDADRRRDEYWRRPPGEEVQDKEIVLRRTVERDDNARRSGESMALSRVDDRRESRFSDYEVVNNPRQSLDERERDVSRYIRTTDYYTPQSQQPQTIIIKQEPIIIRERVRDRDRSRSRSRDRREEDFQIVKKSDIDEERSVARSRAEPREEEYFYEKKVRERIDDDRRDRRPRREISPGDSISQVGRRHRGYSSDDSMVYVRKEKIEEGYGSDDGHRGRDLAAGAIAGVGAAELFRNHNRKEGKDTSHGAGRVVRDVGAGAVGVVAAEALRRYRSKSRHRSRSDSRGRGGRRGSGSRSRSHSRVKTVGALGLAGAAILAGAALANRNSKNNESPGRRSRSRTRRSSRSRSRPRSSSRGSELTALENDPNAKDARNPKHRNARIAGAGAIGAVAAALLEKHRDNEDPSRERSRSRVRQALPVVATGLGAAALAGLYEKNKAKQEAEEIVRDEGRRSRSRSRTRTNSSYYEGGRQGSITDPSLIEYGNTPMYGNNYGAGYYGKAPPEQDYYNNSTRDIVPAPAAAPSQGYNAREARERSLSRNRNRARSRSMSSDSDRRSHSRRRSRDGVAAGAAGVGAGVAASEYESRRKEKKERRRRSRQRDREQSYGSIDPYNGRDPYEDANWHATHSASFAQQGDPYATQSGFYPQGGQFPPPPGSMPTFNGPQQQQQQQQQHPSYAPQNFPPPPPNHPQAAQFDPYAPNQNPYAPRPRSADENVSAEHNFPAPSNQHRQSSPDGVKTAGRDMTPPLVTVQRPSTSTPVIQPRNTFPGRTNNPFVAGVRDQNLAPSSGEASPGGRNSPNPKGIPVMPDAPSALSRGPDPNTRPNTRFDENDLRELPRSQPVQSPPLVQPIPENPYGRSVDLNAQRTPSRQSSAAERYTPVNMPRPESSNRSFGNVAAARAPRERSETPTRFTQSPIEDPRVTAFKRPEEHQTKGGSVPFMPSPDLRPPSDDFLPQRDWANIYPMSNPNVPSMPNLTVPLQLSQSPPNSGSYVPQAGEASEQRQPRSRSPETPVTSTTPTQEIHKRVSFAAKPEFSEAPKLQRTASDTDLSDADRSRRRHGDDGGDRDRDRDDRHHDNGRRGERDRDGDRDRDSHQRPSSRGDRSRTQSLDRDSDSRRDHDRDRDRDRDRNRSRRSATMNNKSSSRRDRRRDGSPDSDSTEDLPDRFDEHGRKKSGADGRSGDQDLIAQSLEKILGGSGFGDVLGSFLGGSGGGQSSGSGRKSSRSHRN